MIIEVFLDWQPVTRFIVTGNIVRGIVPPQYHHLTDEYPPGGTREGFVRAAIKGTRNKRDLSKSGNGLRIRDKMPESEHPDILPDTPVEKVSALSLKYRYYPVDTSTVMVV